MREVGKGGESGRGRMRVKGTSFPVKRLRFPTTKQKKKPLEPSGDPIKKDYAKWRLGRGIAKKKGSNPSRRLKS